MNQHQHIPEIEQALTRVAGREVTVTFTTHLVPMTRGIMATMYASVTGGRTQRDFIDLYRSYYENRRFVRVRPEGRAAGDEGSVRLQLLRHRFRRR